MNLRLFVFLALGALSSVASANWFDISQEKISGEIFKPVTAKVEVNYPATGTQSYPSMSSLLTNHHYVAPVAIYFIPEDPLPKAVLLAPSFDVVAREMEQIKEAQEVAQEYALITYLQKNSMISVE
jgi:hypothetical protein